MAYEVVIREVNSEKVTEFNKDTNSIREVDIERSKEVFKLRVDGYRPTFLGEVVAFLTDKVK